MTDSRLDEVVPGAGDYLRLDTLSDARWEVYASVDLERAIATTVVDFDQGTDYGKEEFRHRGYDAGDDLVIRVLARRGDWGNLAIPSSGDRCDLGWIHEWAPPGGGDPHRRAVLQQVINTPVGSYFNDMEITEGIRDWAAAELSVSSDPALRWILSADRVRVTESIYGTETWTAIPVAGDGSNRTALALLAELLGEDQARQRAAAFPPTLSEILLVSHGEAAPRSFKLQLATEDVVGFLAAICGEGLPAVVVFRPVDDELDGETAAAQSSGAAVGEPAAASSTTEKGNDGMGEIGEKVGEAIDITRRDWAGLPWDADPYAATDADWIRMPPGTYYLDHLDERWVFLRRGSLAVKVDAGDMRVYWPNL